jgi:hypothetical protein
MTNRRPSAFEADLDQVRTICEIVRMPRRATVKKTYNLPPELVSRAKRILRSATETEAIIRSLEEVAFRDDVERAVRSVAGKLPHFQLPK